MISVRDLRCTYRGGVVALDGVSIEAAAGTITGIIGPNGSGKTTLIKSMAGFLMPDRGTVTIEGRPLADVAPRERARIIAYVPQSTDIPFPFTVLEVVLMGRSPYLKPFALEGRGDVTLAAQIMEETEIHAFAHRRIQELSGGERQRAVLARALVQGARIMLLDEPTASLDLRHKVMFYHILKRRCVERNMTVIAAMHDINLASLFCDRLVLLDGGRVAAYGNPIEVLNEETLRHVFRVGISVINNGVSNTPFILPAAL